MYGFTITVDNVLALEDTQIMEGLTVAELEAAMKRINAFIRSFGKKPDYTSETRWQGEIKFFMKILVRVPIDRKDVVQYYPTFTRGVSKLVEELKNNEKMLDAGEWYEYKKKFSNIHICRIIYKHISSANPDYPPKLPKTMASIIGDIQEKLIAEMQQEKIEFFTLFRLRNRRKEKIKELLEYFFNNNKCIY